MQAVKLRDVRLDSDREVGSLGNGVNRWEDMASGCEDSHVGRSFEDVSQNGVVKTEEDEGRDACLYPSKDNDRPLRKQG